MCQKNYEHKLHFINKPIIKKNFRKKITKLGLENKVH
jgi:hypothetical protein